jgi:hypothetical protein
MNSALASGHFEPFAAEDGVALHFRRTRLGRVEWRAGRQAAV